MGIGTGGDWRGSRKIWGVKMYKVGMFGGCFNPLHLGHVDVIVEASCLCEKLYIILDHSPNHKEEIDIKQRISWLKSVTSDMENVEVVMTVNESKDKDDYDWGRGMADIREAIGSKIDAVFVGSDYKGRGVWEQYFPEAEIRYVDRKRRAISSTMIRKNPYKYFEFLPECVRRYYTKKVVFVGTESCGKTTLVRNLAKVFGTSWVEEVGRAVTYEAGGTELLMREDYEAIIHRHKVAEYEALRKANKVLLVDTEAVVTSFYYFLEFGEDFELGEMTARLNEYDLCLFLEPDVPWVQDGWRFTAEEEKRQENNRLMKEMLVRAGVDFVEISGSYLERFEKARGLIKGLI
jgi:HTH-type transcriptional repressor of NAD biosynthesis genes